MLNPTKVLFLVAIFVLASAVLGQTGGIQYANPDWKTNTTIFSIPHYGIWSPVFTSKGEVVGLRGFNLLLGYTWRNYLEPVKVHRFNTFWEWGFLFFFPYVGFGTDYLFDDNALLTVGMIYLTPYLGFGIKF
ncbi:hypothetical protein [Fervidobacterium thailandense]|uniref:Uncharacterized protein n=1 Tax=Fervidobacterium thailandense TaxID=1008305 RepID=A0A1E3G123_9BACT|nr:hypothetical protein [Fervidobacterium thailandense]ODN29949.1 hypothetical protein A4H02_08060 [Fervidobacterium thailandense]